MTVQEVIDYLLTVENKSIRVVLDCSKPPFVRNIEDISVWGGDDEYVKFE